MEAYLYAQQGSNNAHLSSKNSPLWWPDLPMAETSPAQLMAASAVMYEVHPRDPDYPTYIESTVKGIWETFRCCMANVASLGNEVRDVLYGDELHCEVRVRRLPIFQAISSHSTLSPAAAAGFGVRRHAPDFTLDHSNFPPLAAASTSLPDLRTKPALLEPPSPLLLPKPVFSPRLPPSSSSVSSNLSGMGGDGAGATNPWLSSPATTSGSFSPYSPALSTTSAAAAASPFLPAGAAASPGAQSPFFFTWYGGGAIETLHLDEDDDDGTA